MRKFYLSLTLIAPLAVVAAGPLVLYQVAIRAWDYFLFVGLFLVWVAGLLGVLGLCSCILAPNSTDHTNRRRASLLLAAGVFAALAVLWFLLLSEWLPATAGGRWFLWQNWTVLVVLGVNPAIVAIAEIIRLKPFSARSVPAIHAPRWLPHAPVMGLVVGMLFVLVAIPITQEIVIWWYGRDFDQTVVSAVRDVAGSSQYCVFDEDKGLLVQSLADLDEEAILARAIRSTLAHSRVDFTRWRKHHFRIIVGGDTYWWSFRQREFVPVNRPGWQLAELVATSCAGYRQNPESYNDAYWQRDRIAVQESNFCCPALDQTKLQGEGVIQ